MIGETVRYIRQSALLPRLDQTKDVLEFSFMYNLERVSKLGEPKIGSIIGNEKPSIILLIVEGMMGMVCSDQ